ncbi:LADA_0G04852g1_1 [Lachancea dasiensis]|uniref:LADA_0G04852g1_1 n=1 Tax=Lachancea dasiensis TaxID=1072105 RepID=A0A1G4JSD4_9SACH|nr:LADA_0G04852g1_1 [Lachancea dasiensis]
MSTANSGDGVVKKKRTKVSKACDNCRRRKIKCTGAQPCLNCQTYKCECTYGKLSSASLSSQNPATSSRTFPAKATKSTEFLPQDGLPDPSSNSSNTSDFSNITPTSTSRGDTANGLYEDDEDATRQLQLLRESLRALTSASQSPRVIEAVQNIRQQIHHIETSWQPELRAGSICDIPRSCTSLETQLMMNKYTEKVSLTKYSTIQPSPFVSKAMIVNQHPVVDEMFGLYSPGLLMSLRGIGVLFKNFFDPGVKMAREYKTTLFLMLRFFDACDHFLELGMKSWTIPVENFCSLSGLPFDSKELVIARIVSELPVTLIAKTKELYPQFELPKDLRSDKDMFNWVTRAMAVWCLESKCDVSHCIQNINEMEKLIRVKEVLSVLAFQYLNLTIYIPGGDLDHLESLLSLIKHEYWAGEHHVLFQLRSIICSYSQHLGLHRWEYYVGMDEELAERRREVWWRCYFWDKFFSVLGGKQAEIPDYSVSCLLPVCFRRLGILESDEFLQKIDTLREPLTGRVSEMMLFCSVSLAIVVGDFFRNVLYNKKYTNFRNHAKPTSMKEALMRELCNDVTIFVRRFEIIGFHAKTLRTPSMKYMNENHFTPQEMEDASQADHTVFFLEHAISVCLGAVEHLFARFKVEEYPPDIQRPLKDYRVQIHSSWRCLIHVMGTQDVELVWQTMGSGCMLYMTVLTDLFTPRPHSSQIAMQDVLLVLRASHNLDTLSFLEDCFQEARKYSRALRQLVKHRTFFQILVRISLQLFMRTSQTTVGEFFDRLKITDANLVSAAERVLSLTHDNFKACFVTQEKTPYHLSIERSIEQEQDLTLQISIPSDASGDYSQTKNTIWPSGGAITKTKLADDLQAKESALPMSPSLNFNLTSLDDFLNCGEDDLYNKLWSDINIGIPEFQSLQNAQ